MGDFFIRLSGKDKDWGGWIAWQLHEAGFAIRYQHWAFEASQNVLWQIEQAGQAERVLVPVPPTYFQSEHAIRELAQAQPKERRP